MVHVKALDHIVLLVDDVERSLAWYRDRLGLEVLNYDVWRRGEMSFPSVRVNDATIIDIFHRAPASRERAPNLDHFCIVIEPTDLAELAASGDFDVQSGPVERWGARGVGLSLYVKDPDGNTVEIRHYGESS